MPLSPEVLLLARNKAAEYGLDWKLVAAITEHESRGDSFAVRYEPAFSYRAAFRHPYCSVDTETFLQKCSLGLMQVMGCVARERGFAGTFLTELCEPETGLRYGCLQLVWLQKNRIGTDDLLALVSAYNWGSVRKTETGEFPNQRTYVNPVKALYASLT